jgi:hypothetical protein
MTRREPEFSILFSDHENVYALVWKQHFLNIKRKG